MKKLVAILLLGLFALHHAGYFFIYKALKHQNELTWQSRVIQDDFNPEQLQMASIPITFPYQSDQNEFRYVDESIEMNGKFYRIIKKRYAQDTLHIVYVNDYSSKKIQSDFEKWANQMNQNDAQSNTRDTQNLVRLMDYQYFRSDYSFRPLVLQSVKTTHSEYYLNNFKEVYLSIPSPPPEHMA